MYFSPEAWTSVIEKYNETVKVATCPKCEQLCLENSIQCTKCKYWVHFACDNVSPYAKSGKQKHWKCSDC